MTTQHDLHSDTQVFTTIMSLEMNDKDRSPRGGWNSEARLEILAHEIVRYMPGLANLLVEDGKMKLAA